MFKMLNLLLSLFISTFLLLLLYMGTVTYVSGQRGEEGFENFLQSLTKAGRGFKQMLTIADKGEEGGQANAANQ